MSENSFYADENKILLKFFFLSHHKELSDVKKTYIHMSNGQKFELFGTFFISNFVLF